MVDNKIIFSMVGVGKVYPPNKQVLRDIYLGFYYGAKIGVLGLNGAGKSTLLRIIAGVEKDYLGQVVMSPGYSVGYLEQEPLLDASKTVRQVVEEGVQEVVDTLREFDEINARFGEELTPDEMDALIQRPGRHKLHPAPGSPMLISPHLVGHPHRMIHPASSEAQHAAPDRHLLRQGPIMAREARPTLLIQLPAHGQRAARLCLLCSL